MSFDDEKREADEMWKSINFDLKLTTWQQKMKKKISSIDKNIDNFNHGAMGIDQTYRYISQNPVILSETAPWQKTKKIISRAM